MTPLQISILASGATGHVAAYYANTAGKVSIAATHASMTQMSFGGMYLSA